MQSKAQTQVPSPNHKIASFAETRKEKKVTYIQEEIV